MLCYGILLELFFPESEILKKEGEFEKKAANLIEMEKQFVTEFETIRDLSDEKLEHKLIAEFNNKANQILAVVDRMCWVLVRTIGY